MKSVDDLTAALHTSTAALLALKNAGTRWPAAQQRIIGEYVDSMREQGKILFDRHMALLSALLFALEMRRDPETNAWVDTLGNVLEPPPDVAFLLAEAELKRAHARPPHLRSLDL